MPCSRSCFARRLRVPANPDATSSCAAASTAGSVGDSRPPGDLSSPPTALRSQAPTSDRGRHGSAWCVVFPFTASRYPDGGAGVLSTALPPPSGLLSGHLVVPVGRRRPTRQAHSSPPRPLTPSRRPSSSGPTRGGPRSAAHLHVVRPPKAPRPSGAHPIGANLTHRPFASKTKKRQVSPRSRHPPPDISRADLSNWPVHFFVGGQAVARSLAGSWPAP